MQMLHLMLKNEKQKMKKEISLENKNSNNKKNGRKKLIAKNIKDIIK